MSKPTTEYYRDKTRTDGLRSLCKRCFCEKTSQVQQDNPERSRRYTKKWEQKNKDRLTEKARRWRVNNPEESRAWASKKRAEKPYLQRAHNAVRQALKVGVLTRPETCLINNSRCRGRIEAHHDDYSRELDVTWLCMSHHSGWHRIFIAEGF